MEAPAPAPTTPAVPFEYEDDALYRLLMAEFAGQRGHLDVAPKSSRMPSAAPRREAAAPGSNRQRARGVIDRLGIGGNWLVAAGRDPGVARRYARRRRGAHYRALTAAGAGRDALEL